jgi:hypothetical protein
MTTVVTIKNSCGGQGCSAPYYTLPYGESYDFESKFGKPQIKVPPVQHPKNNKGKKK